MRFLVALSILALAVPATAAPPSLEKQISAFARRAQVAGARTVDSALDDAAAYWFARERNGTASLQGSGPALAAAIRLGRAEALRGADRPLPAELKRAFRGHFPSAVLDRTRYVVAAPDSRLGRLLARWPVQNGAVTLDDVIVFKTARGPANPRLFAHELTHVEQYRRLGVDGFAARYAANRAALEEEATVKARRVTSSA